MRRYKFKKSSKIRELLLDTNLTPPEIWSMDDNGSLKRIYPWGIADLIQKNFQFIDPIIDPKIIDEIFGFFPQIEKNDPLFKHKILSSLKPEIHSAVGTVLRSLPERTLYLTGNNWIFPSIYVSNRVKHFHQKYEPILTEEFIRKSGYQRFVQPNDVEVRDMGAAGGGLFAKVEIPENTIIAVYGGTVLRSLNIKDDSNSRIYVNDTNEKSGISSLDASISDLYRQTCIIGDGCCAADKIQHAFPLGIFSRNGLELPENAAPPNIDIEKIKTPCGFALIVAKSNTVIKVGEAFFRNYGIEYVLQKINPFIVFNKVGEKVAEIENLEERLRTFAKESSSEKSNMQMGI